MKQLSMTGRNALWQKLMPARAGSAQDAAERMKSLKLGSCYTGFII